jgi:hypothetical protein
VGRGFERLLDQAHLAPRAIEFLEQVGIGIALVRDLGRKKCLAAQAHKNLMHDQGGDPEQATQHRRVQHVDLSQTDGRREGDTAGDGRIGQGDQEVERAQDHSPRVSRRVVLADRSRHQDLDAKLLRYD